MYFRTGDTNLDFQGSLISVAGTLTFNDSFCTQDWTQNGTFLVSGDYFIINCGMGSSASVNVKLVGSGVQNVDASGATFGYSPPLEIASSGTVNFIGGIFIQGNFIYTSGTVTAGASIIGFTPAYGSAIATISAGTFIYNKILFHGNDGMWDLAGSTLKVGGTLEFSNQVTGCPAVVSNGIVEAQSNVTITARGGCGNSATIKLTGTNPTITTTAALSPKIPKIEVAVTGTLTVVGNLNVTGDLLWTSGALSMGAGNNWDFSETSFSGANVSINPGGVTYANVSISGVKGVMYNLNGQTMNISGNLTFGDANNSPVPLNNGTFSVGGNVTSVIRGCSGSVAFNLTGNNSTINAGGLFFPTGGITVAKTAGQTVSLATNFSNASMPLTVTSGAFNMMNFALDISALSLNTNTLTKGGGALTVGGSGVATGALYGGSVAS